MASGLSEDWGGGIYRGRRAPANAVYDAVNALVNGESLLFKRGGSAYLSASNTTNNLLGVAAVSVAAGDRVLAWDSGKTYVLDGSNTPLNLQNPFGPADFVTYPMARIPVTQGCAVIPQATDTTGVAMLLWAGSRKNLPNTTFTVDLVNGSRDASGAGTPAWLTTIDRGVFLAADAVGIVDQVVSNTALKLRDPWAGATATALVTMSSALLPSALVSSQETWNGIVWTIANRIVFALGNRIYFTPRDIVNDISVTTVPFSASDYHELSTGSQIAGGDAFGDTLVPFSTTGAWAIQNMSFDAVDDFGNIQQSVGQINDVVLWGNPGVARWNNTIIAPGIADVFLLDPGGATQPITGGRGNQYDDGIRVLYRSYVAAGYQPGTASVYRSHYVLPVINPASNALVDVLVCRLDMGFAWTRWSGHAAGIAYSRSVGASTRSPKLLGINLKRVTDLTGCFDPATSNATEADATVHDCTFTTRDYPTGQQPGFVQKIRGRYELTSDGAGSTPTVTAAFSSDQDAGAFTTLTEKGAQGGTSGWATSDGSKYQWARVGKRRERIRFKFTQTGAAGSFVWRLLEIIQRPQGRQ